MTNKINFTKATIDALPLPAQGGRAEYWDTKTSGLQVRLTSAGVRTFYVRRRVKGGGVERVMLGRYPDLTPDEARRKAAEINADIAKGVNPAEIKRERKGEMTFAKLFTEYLERHSKKNK